MEIKKGPVDEGAFMLQYVGLKGGHAWQRNKLELAQRQESIRHVQERATFFIQCYWHTPTNYKDHAWGRLSFIWSKKQICKIVAPSKTTKCLHGVNAIHQTFMDHLLFYHQRRVSLNPWSHSNFKQMSRTFSVFYKTLGGDTLPIFYWTGRNVSKRYILKFDKLLVHNANVFLFFLL